MGIFDLFKGKEKNESTEKAISTVSSSQLPTDPGTDPAAVADQMLMEVKTDLSTLNAVRLPIAEIATLGAGVSSLLPSLRTVTQTAQIGGTGLYRLANAGIGDALKAAKDGSFWGAMRTAGGTSKMAKFVEAGPLSATTQSVAAINPATLMIAAALANVEKQLGEIAEMERQILSFLEEDKEAQVEGDIKTLSNIIKEYKYNWNSSEYTQNHHKLALDIKRKADQNIIFYQKQVADILRNNPLLYMNQFADNTQNDLQKRFKYYRMSLFIYSFASFLEVMLLGNFNEDYIQQVVEKIEGYALEYRNLFTECSNRLEKIAGNTVEAMAMKGLGAAAKAVGNLLGNVQFIKDGGANEWLVKNGDQLEHGSEENARKLIEQFATISDPGCGLFINNLRHVDRLCNQTSEIYIDKDSVYLVKETA